MACVELEDSKMKTTTLFALILFLLTLAALRVLAQSLPALPPVHFGWIEPTNAIDYTSYRLQWRTGYALLPIGTSNETIQYFPSGFSETVGISSIKGAVESETNIIQIMSVLAHFQSDRGDGSGWKNRTSLWFVVQLESNEVFRVMLEASK